MPMLFCANFLVMANSRDEVKEMKVMEKATAECGLQRSAIKSECLIINRKKKEQLPEKLSGIKITNSINYLDVAICLRW